MSRPQRITRKIELVEVNNISLSLQRLDEVKPWTSRRWKRTLYHALLLSEVVSDEMCVKIRTALELP